MNGSDEPGSPAWWFEKLLREFDARVPERWGADRGYREPGDNDTRRDRLERLWSYYIGRAPLPQVATEYTEVFRAVMRKARSNYAEMCIAAMSNRMALNGISTAQDNVGGDDLANDIVEVSNLEAEIQDLFAYLFVMSETYGMVVAPKAGSGSPPMIKALDPRKCVGDPDPDNPQVLRAAMVRSFDEMFQIERAILFLPGKAYRAKKPANPFGGVSFQKWEWDGEPEDITGIDDLGGVPIVRIDNKDGMGEFEAHMDLLDRINDTTLQRIVIAWYQSFKQRAVEGDLEGDDDEPMSLEEFNEIFRSDPGALWRVPAGVKFWESTQAELTPIINAKRDDVKEFAAVTSTPMYLISSDSANQSAEGASLVREGINHKVKDRRARVAPKIKLLFRMAFAFAGQPERGARIRIDWGALENNSLADKGSATAQSTGVLSKRRQLIDIWGYTPQEAEEIILELAAEQILTTNAAQGATTAAGVPATDAASISSEFEDALP
ncbi:phage portal protein [Nocardia otitidiscaviarum]|uniref:phage portal protein n=1 Tax=Nocardia otitidiscaviarum TaxID=1823 RepID=UPI0009E0B6A8|nr:phage portal protein [Nocardia otitidiscaviarum]